MKCFLEACGSSLTFVWRALHEAISSGFVRCRCCVRGCAHSCAGRVGEADLDAAAQSTTTRPTASLPATAGNGDAKKGPGVFGLSILDSVYVELGSNPEACSGPPSACNQWVAKRLQKDALTTSDQYGSASLTSVTALGTLTGTGKAVSAGLGSPSSGSSISIAWRDTFTATSKTLQPGTPVSFTATLQVTGKPFHCTAAGGANLSIATVGSEGLLFEELCASSPPPVLTATINTQISSTFTDGVGST